MASRRAASSLRRCSSARRASSSVRRRRSSASRAARSAAALASASARATASLSASSSLIRFSSRLINSLSEKRTELSFCSAIFRVSSIRRAESALHFTRCAYQSSKSFVKHSRGYPQTHKSKTVAPVSPGNLTRIVEPGRIDEFDSAICQTLGSNRRMNDVCGCGSDGGEVRFGREVSALRFRGARDIERGIVHVEFTFAFTLGLECGDGGTGFGAYYWNGLEGSGAGGGCGRGRAGA